MHIVIPGGSGQLGNLLARYFHSKGHRVTILSRDPAYADSQSPSPSSLSSSSSPWSVVYWDGRTLGYWTEFLENADAVIHLSGKSVNCRYNSKNRHDIIESRVVPTCLIGEAIAKAKKPPAIWINASSTTYYRESYDTPQDEFNGELVGDESNLPDTWKFSLDVLRRWEDSFNSCLTPHTRKVTVRLSMVMSPDPGGVFTVLSRLVRIGLGGTEGSGKQFVSWVHGDDFVRAIDFIISNPQLPSIVNITSPFPIPNYLFLQQLRQAWNVPFGLPATQWMLEIGAIFMRTETELILKSRKTVPGVLMQYGFHFNHANWQEAAANLAIKAREINSVPIIPSKKWFLMLVYIVIAFCFIFYLIK